MFSGSFLYTLDSKNRLSIPAKLRKYLQPEAKDSFMVTQGMDSSLALYPLDQWQLMMERLKNLNQFDPDERKFSREFLRYATDVEMDNQSRIILPHTHIQLVRIEKDVLIVGAINKIELWNPKTYEDYISNTPENYEKLAAKVMTGK